MSWSSVIIAGILTYLTRTTMITLVDRRVLSTKLIQVLGYVPAAVFPAIIFYFFKYKFSTSLHKLINLYFLILIES